jgi:hypothetical protein
MLLGMLFKQAFRRLLPPETTLDWPTAPAEEVPATIRCDQPTAGIPETTAVDGWREMANRQSYRAAWIRRSAIRFGAATRGELREEARTEMGDRRWRGADA